MRLPLLPLAALLTLAALPAFAQAGPPAPARTRPPSNAKSGPVFSDAPPPTAAPPRDPEPFEPFGTIHTVPKPAPTTVLASPDAPPPAQTVPPKKHAPARKPAGRTARKPAGMKMPMRKMPMRRMSLYSTTHTLPKPTTGAAKTTKPSHP